MYNPAEMETETVGVCDAPPAPAAAPVPPASSYRTQGQEAAGRFAATEVAGHVVLRPHGALTFQVCDEFRQAATEALGDSARLVLDARDAMLMDSAFLEMLLDVHDEARGMGGEVKLAHLNETCRDILAATRLDKVFSTYDDLSGAVRRR